MWKHFKDNHAVGLTPDQEHNAKIIFYMASAGMYNLLIGALRRDHSLSFLCLISDDVRTDIDQYFGNSPQPIKSGDSNIH